MNSVAFKEARARLLGDLPPTNVGAPALSWLIAHEEDVLAVWRHKGNAVETAHFLGILEVTFADWRIHHLAPNDDPGDIARTSVNGAGAGAGETLADAEPKPEPGAEVEPSQNPLGMTPDETYLWAMRDDRGAEKISVWLDRHRERLIEIIGSLGPTRTAALLDISEPSLSAWRKDNGMRIFGIGEKSVAAKTEDPPAATIGDSPPEVVKVGLVVEETNGHIDLADAAPPDAPFKGHVDNESYVMGGQYRYEIPLVVSALLLQLPAFDNAPSLVAGRERVPGKPLWSRHELDFWLETMRHALEIVYDVTEDEEG